MSSSPCSPSSRALALAFSLCSSALAQTTIHVDATGPGCPGTGTPTNPFCTIQAGINAANNGDTVLVADGLYAGPGNTGLFFPGGPVTAFTLRSENGPDRCIIDLGSGGPAFTFVADEPPGLVIQGFTIQNGNTSMGGAVYLHHDGSPTFVDCILANNGALVGGAVACDSSDGTPTFVGCTFDQNSARYGGALYLAPDAAIPTLVNCLFIGNSATRDGGAAMIAGTSSAVFLNCTVAGNSAAHSGGGFFADPGTEVRVTNSILWGNGASGQIVGPGTVTFSNVQGGRAGAGNINSDPRFADAPGGDYHLLATSPCIGNGSTVAGLPADDFEGDPRVAFGQVDMGADEFFQHLYQAGEATPGRTIEIRFLGRPGEPVLWLLAANTRMPGTAIGGLNGLLLLELQSLTALGVGSAPVSGLVRLPVRIRPRFAGATVPTQALVGLQLTNLSPIEVR